LAATLFFFEHARRNGKLPAKASLLKSKRSKADPRPDPDPTPTG